MEVRYLSTSLTTKIMPPKEPTKKKKKATKTKTPRLPVSARTKPTSKSLPPDPEEMNEARAGWARKALATFMVETNQVDEVEALGDLAADLMHLGDRLGLPAKDLIERTVYNYQEETRSE